MYCLSMPYLGTVPWEIARYEQTDDHEDDWVLEHTLSDYRITLTLRLPLSSSQLDFRILYGMGGPSCALCITHIIAPESELERSINDVMFRTQDVAGLHRLFVTKKLSIYSENRDCNLFNVGCLT